MSSPPFFEEFSFLSVTLLTSEEKMVDRISYVTIYDELR